MPASAAGLGEGLAAWGQMPTGRRAGPSETPARLPLEASQEMVCSQGSKDKASCTSAHVGTEGAGKITLYRVGRTSDGLGEPGATQEPSLL